MSEARRPISHKRQSPPGRGSRGLPRRVAALALTVSLSGLATTPLSAAETAITTPAKPPYPGQTLLSATALDSTFTLAGVAAATDTTKGSSFLVPGFGLRGVLGIEGYQRRKLALEMALGYRWLDQAGTPLPLPGVSFAVGWRLDTNWGFSLTPMAGSALELVCNDASPDAAVSLKGGVRASFRLSGRDYLTVTPEVSLPLMNLLAPSITVAVGMRSERPWLVPVPAVRPSVSVTPRLFSPDGDGVDETVRIRLGVANPRSLAAWHFYVMAPDGTVFLSRAGTSAPPEPLTWDGAYDVGEPTGVKLDIEPATDYRVILDTSDILGRAQRAETTLTVDILVIKEGDHYKIRVPDIIFPSNSAELSAKNSRDLLAANRRVLERIATLFARFPGYSLAVEGHANAVYWSDPKRREKEQTEELIPLSRRRAESVKQALILLGIDAARIRTVARGGTAPLSAFADSGSAWKNRRVEFILEK